MYRQIPCTLSFFYNGFLSIRFNPHRYHWLVVCAFIDSLSVCPAARVCTLIKDIAIVVLRVGYLTNRGKWLAHWLKNRLDADHCLTIRKNNLQSWAKNLTSFVAYYPGKNILCPEDWRKTFYPNQITHPSFYRQLFDPLKTVWSLLCCIHVSFYPCATWVRLTGIGTTNDPSISRNSFGAMISHNFKAKNEISVLLCVSDI